ncbi:hypothetical protein WJX82_008347 [Trebouxia sp. C0006]
MSCESHAVTSAGQSSHQGDVVSSSPYSQGNGFNTAQVASKRSVLIGPNSALSFDEPLYIVRGRGQYLYDAEGNQYLDCCNNVAHVGHCHPKVTAAVTKQLETLNTNSRYLHDKLVVLAEGITRKMPEPLQVMYAVCSGSEANDLALRVARANRPGAWHVAVMEGAYHGHTTATLDLSPYKFDGPGGMGKPPHVHVLPCPDVFRGHNLDGRAAAQAAVDAAHKVGGHVSAFFCESILSCGGQVVLPAGYLQQVYDVMHQAGAVCIADEVQCGFGRVGSHFWGFELQSVVPDMVTLGKPIGNGFPMGAVVMTPKLAQGFSNGMEYFNTCGGCTGAAAAGVAVLEAIEEDRLQQHAHQVGTYLIHQLEALQKDYPCIGHVRGMGLFVGFELVIPDSQKPAPGTAKFVKEAMKARRVLVSTDGHHNQVIKIKPPMCFDKSNVDTLMANLIDLLKPGVPAAVQEIDRAYDPNKKSTRIQNTTWQAMPSNGVQGV